MRTMIRRLLPAAIVAVLLVGAAGYFALNRPPGEQTTSFRSGSLVVAEPFVLATQPGAQYTAGYMRIENGGSEGDRLVSGTVEVAARVEIEEGEAKGGVTSVHPLQDGLAIPPGGRVQLRPGSYQLHFADLSRPLREGEHFAGTLTFEKAGTVAVTYAVGPLLNPIGGAFSLIDQDGEAFSDADLKGKPYAIFFGYTHCPDVCPTTLFEMSAALQKLGADAGALNVVFVSVDPERDTPALLKDYLSAFDPHIVGLTGTMESVAAAAKTFHVVYRKNPAEGGDYSMDHSASVLLMDTEGRFVGTISYGEDVDVRFEKLKQLVAG